MPYIHCVPTRYHTVSGIEDTTLNKVSSGEQLLVERVGSSQGSSRMHFEEHMTIAKL